MKDVKKSVLIIYILFFGNKFLVLYPILKKKNTYIFNLLDSFFKI